MSVYLVTWDLNKEGSSYSNARRKLINHINNSYTNNYDSGLDSVRFISTSKTASQLSNDLKKQIDDNDKLIVVKMFSGHYQGWLKGSLWDWIRQRV